VEGAASCLTHQFLLSSSRHVFGDLHVRQQYSLSDDTPDHTREMRQRSRCCTVLLLLQQQQLLRLHQSSEAMEKTLQRAANETQYLLRDDRQGKARESGSGRAR
jgi:hypothetical protein